MSNIIEISEQELLNILKQAFIDGLCSYADLAEFSCHAILQKFIDDKKKNAKVNLGISTTYTNHESAISWNDEHLSNMQAFLSNVIISH